MGQGRTLGIKRCAAMLMAAFLFVSVLPGAAAVQAQEGRTLRVAFPQVPGFSETDENGDRHGLVVDYLNEIAKYTGWEYEYIATGDDAVSEFLSGDFDLIGGNYYASALEEYFAYPDYDCGHTESVLLARRDDQSISGYDMRDLNGKVIGVYERAVENIRRLQAFLDFNGVEYTLKYYTYEQLNGADLYPYLESGEVDLLLGNSAERPEQTRVVATFDAQPHYIVTTPDNQEVLDGLNMALGKIMGSNPNFAEERYAANFPDGGRVDVILDEDELAYIRRKQTVVVAVPSEYHPFYCMEETEGHTGIIPDLLAEVTAFSGLEFTYVETQSYREALDIVLAGEADLLGFFSGGEDQAAGMGLALTQSYATVSDIIMRNKSVSYPAEGLTCAILEGRGLPDGIEASEVKAYPSIAEAVRAVNRGEVDFVLGLSPSLEREIQHNYYPNVVPVSLHEQSLNIGFAVRKPVQADLLTIMNKSINQLSGEEKEAITSHNIISTGVSNLSLGSLIYSDPVLFVTVVSLFLLLAVGVVLATARARVRAAGMRVELERAEAESRAKSDFLSRMSHEIRTPMNAVVGLADLTSMMEGVPEKVQDNLAKIRSSSHYLLSLINDILDMSRIDSHMLTIAQEPFSLSRMLGDLESMMGTEAARRGLKLECEVSVERDGLTGDATRLRQVLTNLLSNALKFTPAGGTVRLTVTQTGADERGAVFLFRVSDDGVGIPEEDQQRVFDAFEQIGPSSTRSQGTGLGLPISSSIVRLMGGELKLDSVPGRGSSFYFTVTLPYGTPAEERQRLTAQGLLAGKTFLLAEDNELNAQIAVQLLALQGAKVEAVPDGRAAVERFASSGLGEFQAILMDIQMPEMDGLEATRAIRALPRPDALSVPIVAMTANSFQEDIDAADRAGMDAFVTKPLDVERLYGVLQDLLAER